MESPRSRTLGNRASGWGGRTSHVHSISSGAETAFCAVEGMGAALAHAIARKITQKRRRLAANIETGLQSVKFNFMIVLRLPRGLLPPRDQRLRPARSS